MSQFYIQSTGGGGPLPPDVPTTFTTDLNSIGGAGGVVVPENNNVFVLGDPLAPIGTQGILTQSISTLSLDLNTIYIRYISETVTTTTNAQTPLIGLTPSDDSSFTLSAMATAFDKTAGPSFGDSFGGRLLVVGNKVGGVVTITAVLENVSGGNGPLNGCAINAISGGASVAITVTGLTGHTIDWFVMVPQLASTT